MSPASHHRNGFCAHAARHLGTLRLSILALPGLTLAGLAAWSACTPARAADAGAPTVEISFVEAVADAGASGVDAAQTRPPTVVAAIGLKAIGGAAASGGSDVVVLVDTSASQAGSIRHQARQAAVAVIESMRASEGGRREGSGNGPRLMLAAIDVSTVRLMPSFAEAGSTAVEEGLARFDARAPLGTTEMTAGLSETAAAFDRDGDALDGPSASRRIVYIGDGPAVGGIDTKDFRRLVGLLRDRRISVSAVGVGDRVNWPFLAALANATGGVLAVPHGKLSASDAGARVGAMALAPVFWPRDVILSDTAPDSGMRLLPEAFPPLRGDRDSVFLVRGLLAEPRLEMDLVGERSNDGPKDSPGGSTHVAVRVPAVTPKPDNAYVAELFRNAASTGGLFLPTLGREGLDLARAAVRGEAAMLAVLGRQAEDVGARDAALRLAAASLRRDPDNVEAALVQTAAGKEGGQLRLAAQNDSDDSPFDAEELPAAKAEPEPPAGFERAPEPLVSGRTGDEAELREAERMRSVRAGQLEKETQVRLRDARLRFATDPAAARDDLKGLLIDIEQSDDLDAAMRERLRRQVEMRIREANQRVMEKEQRDLASERSRAAAREKLQMIDELNRREEKFSTLAKRYHALVEEGIRVGYQRPTTAFTEAEREVALGPGGLAELAPNLYANQGMPMTARVVARTAPLVARILDYDAENTRVRRDQERGFMDTLHLVDVAAIPFPDEPPIVYPSAARWQEITRLREKYKSVDLANPGSAEQKIYEALDKPVDSLRFDETPLRDVVAALQDQQGIPVQLDTRALEDAGLDLETPVTKTVSNIALRSALRLLLSEVDLTYIIKDEVLLITTKEKADENLVVKVYPVADLVLPVNPSSGLNPFQSGGGLGGAGGINSGMGGGGMGGMGGMGMGGAGGGGMFQVADVRARVTASDRNPTDRGSLSDGTPKAADEPGLVPDEVLAADDLRKAVAAYLAGGTDDAATATRMAALRKTSLEFGRKGAFSKAADLLCGAIVAGRAEPWMYEALATAGEAGGWDRGEVERVLLSSADFATTSTELMSLAQYFARVGSNRRAIDVCRRVVRLEPTNREAYALAMTLAAKEEDATALEWSCTGVLAHDWPAGQEQIAARAARLAKITIDTLAAEGRAEEAASLRRAVDEALVRDIEITITWGGDADVDMIVEEPTGAACSFASPRTSSGGTLLAAAAGGGVEQRERYVCAEAFSGTYRGLIRRVWGDVVADTVTVEMVLHRGTDREERMRKQLPLGSGEILVTVDLPNGRRREPIEDARVAQDVVAQQAIGRGVLAQQLAAMSDPAAAESFERSRGSSQSGPVPGLPFFRRGAAGYQPVITTLPEGINMFARAVVSADRRYVRVTATPLFSGVGQVTQFNFSGSGAQGTGQVGGAGGAGGGAGGIGGGAGGIGGGAGGIGGGAGGIGGGAGGIGGGGGAGGAGAGVF